MTGLVVTSCNRVKQVLVALAANATVIREKCAVIIVDNSTPQYTWADSPASQPGNSFIFEDSYCSDSSLLDSAPTFFAKDVIVRVIRVSPWQEKQIGDAELTAIGISTAFILGCEFAVKLTGVSVMQSDLMTDAAKLLAQADLLTTQRHWISGETSTRVFACRTKAVLQAGLFTPPWAGGGHHFEVRAEQAFATSKLRRVPWRSEPDLLVDEGRNPQSPQYRDALERILGTTKSDNAVVREFLAGGVWKKSPSPVRPRFSILVPTVGRPSLARALNSLKTQGDISDVEVVVVADGGNPATHEMFKQAGIKGTVIDTEKPHNDWGASATQLGMTHARGQYILRLDDDNELAPGMFPVVRAALVEKPNCPHLFRIVRGPHREKLWAAPSVHEGNVDSMMVVFPNVPERLGKWGNRYAGDFDFVSQTAKFYPPDSLIWRSEVLGIWRIGSVQFPHDVGGRLSQAEGEALYNLAGAQRVLELGGFPGRATICMAQSASFIVSIDPFESRMGHERTPLQEYLSNLTKYGVSDRVKCYSGTSTDIGPKLPNQSFDLVLIGSERASPTIAQDIALARRVLAPGGRIVIGVFQSSLAEAANHSGLTVDVTLDSLAVCRVTAPIPRMISHPTRVTTQPGITMVTEKVSCLMATYGRYSRVCEALGMFLAQDYPNRELIILNNHPVPLQFDHPLVRIVNEPGHPSLGHCRNRLLDFADGEFIRTWDDDDLYLPWCISQGVDHIGNCQAWKPTRSWFTNGGKTFTLQGNAMEASVTWRRIAVEQVGYAETLGDEHAPLLARIPMAQTELGAMAGYGYKWGCGEWHASGSLGSKQSLEARTASWMERNNHVKPGVPLIPVEPSGWWRKILPFVPADEREGWAKTCGIPDSEVLVPSS